MLLRQNLLFKYFQSSLTLLKLALSVFQLSLELCILLFKVIKSLLHIAPLLFALASALPSTLAVFEQPILVRRQELSHAYELLFANELYVDGEVSHSNYVTFFELIVDISEGATVE